MFRRALLSLFSFFQCPGGLGVSCFLPSSALGFLCGLLSGNDGFFSISSYVTFSVSLLGFSDTEDFEYCRTKCGKLR